MIADTLDSDEERLGLRESLALSLRRATDVQVAWYAVAGTLSCGSAVWFRPFAWPLFAAVGVCIAAYGVWGAADRELRERRDLGRVGTAFLLSVRVVAAVAGATAAVTVLLMALGVALGTIMS